MNNNIELLITCIHCLESGTKNIFPIIISGNIVAKEYIFNEELFLYRCPHCGHYQNILYECLYYDEKLKYVIILAEDGNKLLSKINVSNYQISYVKELSELKEKIIIKEHNLDDRIIKIMKNKIRSTLISKASYQLYLINNQEKLLFTLIYPNNEIINTFIFDYSIYSNLKESLF